MQSFLAHNGEGKPFVVKMMDAKRAVIYRVLAENPGPYIANVYSVEEIPDSGFIREDKPSQPTNLFMAVTEYAGECTLERYVVLHGGKLGEAEALDICKMLCAALIIPHEIGIVHRDIKPENIMVCLNLTNGKEFIKLIDFGSSKVYDQSRIADTTIVGSYGFQAPESLTSSTDARTDIYSIGCVLRYMLTGAALGQGDERDKVRIGVQEIIDKCTNVNPAFRYQNVYGPGQSLSNPYTGILSIFSTRIKNHHPINIFEDGMESRDFVYIDDVVDATIRGLEVPEANGHVFNVGTGMAIDVLTVAKTLCEKYGIDVPITVSGNYRLGDIRHNYADISLARKILGFEPKWNFSDGIAQFANWVDQQEIQEDKYEASIEEMKKKGLYK